MNANEPLMTCRNLFIDDIKTGALFVAPGRGWQKPIYWPFGVRHIGGMIFTWALMRNWRSKEMMVTKKVQAGKTREAKCRNASLRLSDCLIVAMKSL